MTPSLKRQVFFNKNISKTNIKVFLLNKVLLKILFNKKKHNIYGILVQKKNKYYM